MCGNNNSWYPLKLEADNENELSPSDDAKPRLAELGIAYRILYKKPAEWSEQDRFDLGKWCESAANETLQSQRERIIDLLQLSGKEWSYNDFKEVIWSFFGTPNKELLARIKKQQAHFAPEMTEDCWQAFCGSPLRNCLNNYDPKKGGVLSIVSNALDKHAINYYNDSYESFDQCINPTVESLNASRPPQQAIEKNKNVEVLDSLPIKSHSMHFDPEIDNAYYQMYDLIEDYVQKLLPAHEQLILKMYLELKINGGSIREKTVAMLADKGYLDANGKPYTGNNVGVITIRLLKELKKHLEAHGYDLSLTI